MIGLQGRGKAFGKAVRVATRTLPSVAVVAVSQAQQRPAAPVPVAPAAVYWLYAGAESADIVQRIRFDGDSLRVEKTVKIGKRPTEVQGPHGLAISADGRYLYVTTAHGEPNGRYWRYVLGPDTLAGSTLLGRYPASIDVTPDGRYTFSANFALYGGMEPSSVSVVETATSREVAKIPTCTMPHGSRVSPDGSRHYSACMMDDQLVEIDVARSAVARRFSLVPGAEGPVAVNRRRGQGSRGGDGGREHGDGDVHHGSGPQLSVAPALTGSTPATCSPTWAQPSADGTTIFVACNRADEIVEIERDRWAVARRFKTGRGPYNLAVTPDGKLLVATLKQGAKVEIFDLASGASVAQLPTSNTVTHGVAISPDSRYAFVTSEGVGAAPGKVDAYDLRARAKVASVDVGQQASGVAFWKMEPPK